MRLFIPIVIASVLATSYAVNAQVSSTPAAESGGDQTHADEATKPVDMHKHMQMMNKMMVQHLGEAGPEYDAKFIDMMIPHHEGAVMMARHALKHSQRPEIKAMAEKTIKDQQKEIEQLKAFRKAWYGEQAGAPSNEPAR
jgi:uncharacterized protein (DUF305 family)